MLTTHVNNLNSHCAFYKRRYNISVFDVQENKETIIVTEKINKPRKNNKGDFLWWYLIDISTCFMHSFNWFWVSFVFVFVVVVPLPTYILPILLLLLLSTTSWSLLLAKTSFFLFSQNQKKKTKLKSSFVCVPEIWCECRMLSTTNYIYYYFVCTFTENFLFL